MWRRQKTKIVHQDSDKKTRSRFSLVGIRKKIIELKVKGLWGVKINPRGVQVAVYWLKNDARWTTTHWGQQSEMAKKSRAAPPPLEVDGFVISLGPAGSKNVLAG